MERLIIQTRLKYSGSVHHHRQHVSSETREITPSQHTEFLKEDDRKQNQLQRKSNEDYDSSSDTDIATAIASAAFAVYALEEEESHEKSMRRNGLQSSRTKPIITKSGIEDTTRVQGSGTIHQLFSSNESAISGEVSMKKSMKPENKVWKNNFLQVRSIPSPGKSNIEIDSWEQTQMEDIRNRYESTRTSILQWENEKKMEAKIKSERKQYDLGHKRELVQLHYENKISRIDLKVSRTMTKAVEKRRTEEWYAREKDRKVRSMARSPSTCFCFW